MAQVQLLHADGAVGLEGENDNHDHRGHVDDEEHIGVDVGQYIGHRVCDLLLLQLGLGLGDGEIVAPALIGGEHRQQDDGEHGQDDGQQSRPGLREGLIRSGGAGQPYDLRVNGVIAQQGGGGHSAQSGDKGHHRQGEHGGYKGGENHLPQHLEGLGPHVAGRFHGVVVDAPDGIAQEQGVVAGAGKGHGEEHRVEAGKPVGIEVRPGLLDGGGQDAVRGVEEQIPGDQGNAAVNHGGHIAQAEDLGALDVKILCQQHDGHTHHVYRDDQADGQLQGVPHILAHVAGKEELDHRPGLPFPGGVGGVEDACQRIQAGQQHKAKEQIREQSQAHHPEHKFRRQAPVQAFAHPCTSASSVAG